MLAWANCALFVAAVLKFIPILISLAHGLTLTAEQIDAGLATAGRRRASITTSRRFRRPGASALANVVLACVFALSWLVSR